MARNTLFGYCPVCHGSVQLDEKPPNMEADDAAYAPDTMFFVITEHENLVTGARCDGVGERPEEFSSEESEDDHSV